MKAFAVMTSAVIALGGLTACGRSGSSVGGSGDHDFKVGLICCHDDYSTYDLNFIESLEVARKKVDEVNQQAVESRKKGVHVFKMKGSIEDLQENQVALAESNKINMDLQEKSLEYQKKLSETMQYLFGLGVANITMNRCVVKELMMRLDDASEEEIDEMTRKEILKVIQQLKAQEDLYIS